MQSKYNPKDFEQAVYTLWQESGSFRAEADPSKEPFTIVLPPPNITGILHAGHALNHTIQDLIIRHKRMKGYSALWLPGTDHASIATEVRILSTLKETEGLTKDDISREDFLQRAWAWKEQYGGRIIEQMKKLGDSCDWSRERFTMDEGCSDAVVEMFIRLYEKGLIYKGHRMVNWCHHDMTTLSDAEVEYEERESYLYYVKYPLVDENLQDLPQEDGKKNYVLVATSRPETIFADVAIAVNPEDESTKHLIGRKVRVPMHDRIIPVIADDSIEIGFGTGCLKVTPAHSQADYEIGQKNNLETVSVIGLDGKMNELARKYEGMTVDEARIAFSQDLEARGLLEKKEKYQQNVGCCYRCGNVIEPIVSEQWFVAMERLAKPALEALRSRHFEFYPENYEKIYINWLENIRDWNISRQLWWGHRIPAYTCQSCKKLFVAKEAPDVCPSCGSDHFEQDPDVLDTWFSSALWPFSTLGWPKKTPDLEYFYPTDVLVTGYDIIFFWVARMVFSALEITGEVPFKKVLINGIVRDKQGKKMSKSSGNGIDPLEVIDNYGADALRFSLVHGNSTGQDFRLYTEKFESARNFANKLWNASRFVITGSEAFLKEYASDMQGSPDTASASLHGCLDRLDLSDKWILTNLMKTVREVDEAMEKYEFGLATAKLYDFVWSDYCDWYIELSKKRFYENDSTVRLVLFHVLEHILKLMHPVMPFITEEIYGYLAGSDESAEPAGMKNQRKLLITAKWPEYDASLDFGEQVVADMESVMAAVRSIRNIRAEMEVPNSRKATAYVAGEKAKLLEQNAGYFISLAHCGGVEELGDRDVSGMVSVVLPGAEIYLPMTDLIDFEKERARLGKEIEKLDAEIARIEKKLSNASFVEKAPEKVIAEEKAKLSNYLEMKQAVVARLERLG